MADPAARLATYDDLLARPDDARAEIIAGQIRTAPSPLPKHSRVAGAITRFVGGPFDHDGDSGGPGDWWILAEVDVRFTSHDIVSPDLAGWRRERLPEPWDQRPIDVVPDWICEITSPSNVAYDRVTKAKLYAHSVKHFWLVDPAERILESFELAQGVWTQIGSYDDTAIARIKPFEQIELDVGSFFPPKSR
jgi:Uma2 family endonuclease